MQAEHSNSKTTEWATDNNRLPCHTSNSFLFYYFCKLTWLWLITCFFLLLSVSVGDFQQPFEINVELKGVMQDASVMHINNVHQKSRTLHCGDVSVNQQTQPPSSLAVCWIVINHLVRQQQPAQQSVWAYEMRLQCSGECRIKFDHHVSQIVTSSGQFIDALYSCWLNCQWRSVSCLSLQKCDEIIVLHLGYLNYTQYQVMVSFKGLENITYEIKVKFIVSDTHFQLIKQTLWYCLFVAALDLFISNFFSK